MAEEVKKPRAPRKPRQPKETTVKETNKEITTPPEEEVTPKSPEVTPQELAPEKPEEITPKAEITPEEITPKEITPEVVSKEEVSLPKNISAVQLRKLNPHLSDGKSKWVFEVVKGTSRHIVFKGSYARAFKWAENYCNVHNIAISKIQKIHK